MPVSAAALPAGAVAWPSAGADSSPIKETLAIRPDRIRKLVIMITSPEAIPEPVFCQQVSKL
jgi:hypothetical protein